MLDSWRRLRRDPDFHAGAREMVQSAVVRAYGEERERARQPGYVCRYDEYDAGDIDEIPMSYAGMVKTHAPHTGGPRGPRMASVGTEVRSGN